jgi:hypothetical protein
MKKKSPKSKTVPKKTQPGKKVIKPNKTKIQTKAKSAIKPEPPAPAVKEAPKTSTGPISMQKAALLKQLMKLVEGLDESRLTYLIQQSQILEHNIKIEENARNNGALRSPESKQQTGPGMDKLTIDVKEADDNSYFILIINKYRNFFALDEMKKLVNLCHMAADEKEGANRLFMWFSQNRKDVLNNTDIKGLSDPALLTIYNFIINRYKIKGSG